MKKIAIREYDAALYLDSEEAVSEYLAACLEDFSLDSFLLALGNVADPYRSASISRLCRKSSHPDQPMKTTGYGGFFYVGIACFFVRKWSNERLSHLIC